jgi:hypothetical protein
MIPVLYVDDNSDLLTIGKRYLELGGRSGWSRKARGRGRRSASRCRVPEKLAPIKVITGK